MKQIGSYKIDSDTYADRGTFLIVEYGTYLEDKPVLGF